MHVLCALEFVLYKRYNLKFVIFKEIIYLIKRYTNVRCWNVFINQDCLFIAELFSLARNTDIFSNLDYSILQN